MYNLKFTVPAQYFIYHLSFLKTAIMTQIQDINTAHDLVIFMWEHKTGQFFDKAAFTFGYANWIVCTKFPAKPCLVIENAKELVEQVWPPIFDGEKRDYYNNLKASTEAWINHYISK